VGFLIRQLTFVSHVLPLTTAAKPVIGTWGLDSIHRGLQDFRDSRFGIILFLFNYLRSNPVPRDRTLDKDHQPLQATYTLPAIGHTLDFKFDKGASS
jgi:hypothetical protein